MQVIFDKQMNNLAIFQNRLGFGLALCPPYGYTPCHIIIDGALLK